MPKITVDGTPYPVIEALGFVHDIGSRAWVVRMPDGTERTAIGSTKRARFWTAQDRVKPLVEAIERARPGDVLYALKETPDAPEKESTLHQARAHFAAHDSTEEKKDA